MEKKVKYEDLTNSEKMDHIWEYYKFHIIGAGVAIFFIFSLLNHYIFNPPAEVTFDVSIFAEYAMPEVVDELEVTLQDMMIKEGENEEVLVEFFSILEGQDYNAQQAMVTKMIGKTTLHEYDIMIFEGEFFQSYLQEESLLALNDMIDLGVFEVDESLLKKGSDFDFPNDNFYLVDISDHEGFNRMINTQQGLYLGVFVASKHTEHVEEAIDYIINGFK